MRPMQQRAKPRLIEQLFGLLWVVATIAAIYFFIRGVFFNGEWGYFVAAFTLALVIKALVSTTIVGKAGALGVDTALIVEGQALQRLGAEEQNAGEPSAKELSAGQQSVERLSVGEQSAEQLSAGQQSVGELSLGEQSAEERCGEALSAKNLSAKNLSAKGRGAKGLGADGLDAEELDAKGLDADGLGADGLGAEELDDRATERIAASAQEIAAAFENCSFDLDIEPKDAQLKHMASALAGSQTAAPPRGYVAALFDGYAGHFEAELVETLAYQTPSALANIMLARSADKSLGRGLDLGCGTGLAGVALESHSGPMVGVDVSTAMLQKARDKGIYEALVHQDMVEFLTATDLAFDYFVALDVLPYVGDLTPLLSLIKSRNSRNATLAFSTEHRDSGTYFLEKTGRYTHSKAYVEALCEQFGYRMVHFETRQLRKEQEVFLTGGLYLLTF